MKATITLFRALPVQSKNPQFVSESLLKVTIPRGFVYSPEVVANYSERELVRMAELIGRTAEQFNSSFHKSWRKVKSASITQLLLEQILHYFTTYGFKNLGIYDADFVYIPNEKLDTPDVEEGVRNLVVIKGYTKKELKDKVLKMLSSGIALKKDTLNDIVEILTFVGVSQEDLKEVKNKEARIELYDFLDILPEEPSEFLRYLLYRTINETLLIKSKDVIAKIVAADKTQALLLLTKYKQRYDLRNLAEVFNRFKPLFLAFKTSESMNSIINRISKLSKKCHKPMKKDYLNEITAMIGRGDSISPHLLTHKLREANTFRKIRLAYALKYRTKEVNSILYKIRNGKSWSKSIKCYDAVIKARSNLVLDKVLKSIIEDVNRHVGDKKIYLPTNVEYALPATEKQFTGNLPSGTYVTVDQDMVFGVHWFNHKTRYRDNQVDLDLSLISTEDVKYGWDSYIRSTDRSVLFSGDVTDAPRPKGASELFYLSTGNVLESASILMVNYFNYFPEEVPFEIVVAKHKPSNWRENYVIDPNDIICSVGSKINSKQMILGIVKATDDGIRFYFSESLMGASITSSSSKKITNARQYLLDYYTDTISLNNILYHSNAELVDSEEECDINLSLEKIEKDSILNLLS